MGKGFKYALFTYLIGLVLIGVVVAYSARWIL